jgi:hypothetical protein
MNPLRNQVPGFDFLQGLAKSAGAALPGMNAWIAPTLDPDELEKRIEELRTVQFWLEQNAKLIAASIQALEVQRMTLSTLKSLNVRIGDLSDAMRIKMQDDEGPAKDAASGSTPSQAKAGSSATAAPAGLVDPMQWWGALTQQFSELASQAVKGSGAEKMVEAATQLPVQALKAARDATGGTGRGRAGQTSKATKTAKPAAKKVARRP